MAKKKIHNEVLIQYKLVVVLVIAVRVPLYLSLQAGKKTHARTAMTSMSITSYMQAQNLMA